MSHTFKDAAAPPREWTLNVTVASARAVRDQVLVVGPDGKPRPLNIYALPERRFKGLFELLSDPFALIDTAFVLCAAQAKERNLTKADFEAAIDGDALEQLGDALVEAIPDFFSDIAMRGNLRSVFAKSKTVAARLMARGTAELQAFNPEEADLDKLIEKILTQQSLNSSSGNGPASSASTPDPSPLPTSP